MHNFKPPGSVTLCACAAATAVLTCLILHGLLLRVFVGKDDSRRHVDDLCVHTQHSLGHLSPVLLSDLVFPHASQPHRIHAHQLIYPITVASKAGGGALRQGAAEAVLHELRKTCTQLVDEATLVSRELVKVAVTQVSMCS